MTGAGPADAAEGRLTVRVVDAIRSIAAAAWDRCAGPDNPFVAHAFLDALEASGSVGPRTGWQPQHLVVEDAAGSLLGAAPTYLKTHSYGEYVFDWGWAEAYERAGGRYYPKLQVAVPFTPVPGPRLLVAPGPRAEAARSALIEALERLTTRAGLSSAHVTFPTEAEWQRLGEAGWLQRIGQQYHWRNENYSSFDDFLARLNSRKRKAIRKERREVAASGVRLRVLTGDDLAEEHWAAFFRFYRNTSDRKWGRPYLTRDFFLRLSETMADRIALVLGEADGRFVCGALNLIGSDALYGRNWGAEGNFRFLHFEACYYQAIEFAIARGLARVEAGAQGQHKIQRGYLPVRTYSAHYIRDPALRRAVADYLERETPMVDWEIEGLRAEASPFRQA